NDGADVGPSHSQFWRELNLVELSDHAMRIHLEHSVIFPEIPLLGSTCPVEGISARHLLFGVRHPIPVRVLARRKPVRVEMRLPDVAQAIAVGVRAGNL